LQRSFYRAGHAHAGVLVILGPVALLPVDGNGVGEPYRSLCGGVLWAAVLIPAGFFLPVVPSGRTDCSCCSGRARPPSRLAPSPAASG